MSGSTIGGIVGGAIGFFIGGPAGAQLGFMAGSAIGGYVDPDVFHGPRLNDAQIQTSTEGVPRPIIYGTSAVAGNIIQSGPLVETQKKKRTGKGGPVQVTYHYSRSYAIRVCEGPIAGISRIWRDDKLVYDTRNPADWPDDPNVGQIDADSAMFASRIRIYNGDESQLPDPTLEALPAEHGGGVGNVPAYRGTAYVVITNDDLTERGGAVPQYRFEVVGSGVATPANPSAGTVGAQTHAITVAGEGITAYMGRNQGYAISPLTHVLVGDTFTAGTFSDSLVFSGSPVTHLAGSPGDSRLQLRAYSGGWSIGADGNSGYCELFKNGRFVADLRPTAGTVASWWYAEGQYHPEYGGLIWFDGSSVYIGVRKTGGVTHNKIYRWTLADAGGAIVPAAATSPQVTSGTFFFTHMDAAGTMRAIALTEAQLVTYGGDLSEASRVNLPMALGAMKAFAVDRGQLFILISGELRVYDLATFTLRKTVAITAFAATVNYQIVCSGTSVYLRGGNQFRRVDYQTSCYVVAPKGWRDVPDAPGYIASDAGAVAPLCSSLRASVSRTDKLLSDVVSDIAGRVGVGAAQLDVSQLTDVVPGFVIGKQMTATDALSVLQQGFLFDLPEWDSKLRGIKRGGPTLFAITDDDLVYSDDDEDARAQAIEFPRKYNLVVPDASADYNPAKHTASRNTDNVKAVGEVTTELPINFSRNVAAQKAAIMMKVAWTDAEGRMTRILPEEFSRLTPSDPFTYGGKRWRADRVEYRDGEVVVEARRDRPSAYVSGVTAGTILTPTAPRSSLRGPTVFAAMNLPRLRSGDSVMGMYLAAQGLLAGWQGCDVYLSTDGGLTESVVATITDPATMGYLTAPVTAAATTLPVKIYPGDELDSVTDAQLAARANGYAILTEGVAEVGQFKTATETAAQTYDLADLSRGQLGTIAAEHGVNDRFVLLDGSTFLLPLDASLIGKTLRFRPVTRGTDPANNPAYEVVFEPIFTGAQTVDVYTNASGEPYTDASGSTYYKVNE